MSIKNISHTYNVKDIFKKGKTAIRHKKEKRLAKIYEEYRKAKENYLKTLGGD